MTINSVPAVRSDITEMLTKMREISSKNKIFTEHSTMGVTNSAPTSGIKNFDDVMSMAKNTVSNINQVENTTEQLKNAYLSGDSNVSMSQVILASQKSKLAFEGLVSVRNKILEAYKEIMNMPV